MRKGLLDFCEKNKKRIRLYGAGEYGRKIGVWLDERGLSWDGYIESIPKYDVVLERSVISLTECQAEDVAVIVCVGPKYREEIVSNLRRYGIENYYIVERSEIETIDKENKYNGEYSTNKNVMVLLYHRVIDLDKDPQLLAVSPENFESHIKYLHNNYHILRFEDDWNNIKEKSVVITFDDGYADNYLYAFPILEKYGVTATVFVSTGNIDTDNEMWWDELETLFLLNKDLPNQIEICGEILDLSTAEAITHSYLDAHRLLKAVNYKERERLIGSLRELLCPQGFPRSLYRCMTTPELVKMSDSDIITIGGHTVTHSCLACESIDEQKWEITESKRVIEEKIGRKIEVFSYPFGGANDYTDETCRIAKAAGYKKAAIVKEGLSHDEDCMKIPRNLVRNWGIDEFKRNLNKTWTVYGA